MGPKGWRPPNKKSTQLLAAKQVSSALHRMGSAECTSLTASRGNETVWLKAVEDYTPVVAGNPI